MLCRTGFLPSHQILFFPVLVAETRRLIIDTHAHLTDESLLGNIDAVLREASQAGVGAMLAVATTLESSRQCINLAERFPQVRASVGIHPNYCCQAAAGDWEQVCQLAAHPRVAAIGETGLDRYWDDCPWEVQIESFRRHIRLSQECRHPLVIHTRDCAHETLDFLKAEAVKGPLRGVMHSFTGPLEVAEGCLELGLYISFAGMVTYKNAGDLRAVAKRIPADRILVETDSPYLSPHPLRGQRPNTPARVVHTLRCIAEARAVEPDLLTEQTTQNAIALFGFQVAKSTARGPD